MRGKLITQANTAGDNFALEAELDDVVFSGTNVAEAYHAETQPPLSAQFGFQPRYDFALMHCGHTAH